MMKEKRNLFLDYGGLVFNYDFNRGTLKRAHKIALAHMNSSQEKEISLQELEVAHNKSIREYLRARRKGNYEWKMNKIMGLMLQFLNVSTDIESLERIYKLNDHESIPYPYSKKVLTQLMKDYNLGIISNLPHDSLIFELEREKMIHMFNPIVISCQVGFRKPHPKIYQEALKRAKTTPEESVFISHEQEEVEGAENIGMRGVLVKSLEEVMGVL